MYIFVFGCAVSFSGQINVLCLMSYVSSMYFWRFLGRKHDKLVRKFPYMYIRNVDARLCNSKLNIIRRYSNEYLTSTRISSIGSKANYLAVNMRKCFYYRPSRIPYFPAYRHMGLYVKLLLYSNYWLMCLYMKH